MRASKPVVLVAGVSSGIGLAVAKRFAANGWIVVGTIRSRVGTTALRALQFDLQVAEMMRPRDLERVVETTWRTYGRLDAVVCNAGYGLVAPIDTVQYSQMSEQLAVNVLAPAEFVRHTVPIMRKQGYGTIIGISSLAGQTGLAGSGLYAASKFALEGLFESLFMELAVSGIRIRLVESGGLDVLAPDEAAAARHPVRGGLDEAVAAIVFRAATDSSTRLRYPMGQTRWIRYGRRLMPERWFLRLIRRVTTGN